MRIFLIIIFLQFDLNEIFAVGVTSLLSTLILLLPLQDISGIIFGGCEFKFISRVVYHFVTSNNIFSDKAPNYARYVKSVKEQPEPKAELIKCPVEE
jgi:hypothetical protein